MFNKKKSKLISNKNQGTKNNQDSDLYTDWSSYTFPEFRNSEDEFGDVYWLVDESQVNNNLDYDWDSLIARFLVERQRALKELLNNKQRRRKQSYASINRREKTQSTQDNIDENMPYEGYEVAEQKCIAEDIAFKAVRSDFEIMAKLGYPKAIAMYLSHTEPNKRDQEILDKAVDIANKPVKTPEEWEVVASIDFYKDIHVEYKYFDGCLEKYEGYNLKNYRELLAYCFAADSYSCYACGDKFSYLYEKSMKEKQALEKIVDNSDYASYIRKALMGYYTRYFNSEYPKTKYLDDYMFLNKETYLLLPELNKFSKSSNGVKYSFSKLKEIMGATTFPKLINADKKAEDSADSLIHDMIDRRETISDRLAQARFLALYSDADKKATARGYSKLKNVASLPYISDEMRKAKKTAFLVAIGDKYKKIISAAEDIIEDVVPEPVATHKNTL